MRSGMNLYFTEASMYGCTSRASSVVANVSRGMLFTTSGNAP